LSKVPATRQEDHPTSVAILLLEEASESRTLLEKSLTEKGMIILPGGQIEESFELARQRQPDVILLSTSLAGASGSGYPIYRQLKADDSTQAIPVILLSEPGEIAASDMDGVSRVFRPFHPQQVCDSIQQQILIRRLRSQLQAKDQILLKYSNEIEVASEIGKQITSILSPDQLTRAVVDLRQARFDY